METSPARPFTQPKSKAASKPDRLFYSATAVIILLVVLAGFRHFYFQGQAYPGRPIAPPVKTLAITHGMTMGAWILVYLAQTLLIAGRRHRVHMRLGWASLLLAVAAVVTGFLLTVEGTRLQPPDFTFFAITGKQFMAIPILNLVVFTAFIGVGVWKRKKPAIHRPMLMLATLSATPAALARIDIINAIYQGTVWEYWFGPFLPTLLLGGLLLLVKCLLSRAFDRALAVGLAAFVFASALTLWFARTAMWDAVAGWLLG